MIDSLLTTQSYLCLMYGLYASGVPQPCVCHVCVYVCTEVRPWTVWLMEGGEVKLAPPSTPELLDAYDDHTYVRQAHLSYLKGEGGRGDRREKYMCMWN